MKNTIFIFIFILLSLISCTSENNTSNPTDLVNCATSALVTTTKPNVNEIVVEVSSSRKAMANVVVQLDNNGVCLKTDVNGKVLFSNLSAGTHDVHVFGPPGFDWSSVYNIDATELAVDTERVINISIFDRKPSIGGGSPKPVFNSYINLKGAITTKAPENEVFYFVTFDKTNSNIEKERISFPTLTKNYVLQYGFLNDFPSNTSIPIGTQVQAEIWAFEYSKNVLTGESVLINAVKSSLSLNTTSNTADASVHDINLTQQSASTPMELVTFGNQVVVPTGFAITRISIFSGSPSNPVLENKSIPLMLVKQNDLAIKPSYSVNIPQLLVDQYTAISFTVNASNASGATWQFGTGGIPVATNVDVSTQQEPIINVSNFPDGIISWSSAATIPLSRSIIIEALTEFTPQWSIKIKGDSNTVNSISLPSLPDGLNPILTIGDEYGIIFDSDFIHDNNSQPIKEIFRTRIIRRY
ncbi:hypothetical protein MNBD_GAMMA22-1203 [hydrothermal vent metagenome]|uniref:Uncharacterized protein n=1 Tax=hydrothermal vent metagenome TaxID=652676 RepID=A0A3B1AIL8_9ZZZZ